MKREKIRSGLGALICAVLSLQLVGCASFPFNKPDTEPVPKSKPSRLVEISMLTTSANQVNIKPNSRIVISDIGGPCALELKNALAQRLVENAGYDVLTRDYLRQIIGEADDNWGGRFNSQTAVRLGELLGASLFIVGQVIYCGPFDGSEPLLIDREPWDYSGSWDNYQVFAVLQIIDPSTGKVIMSSSNGGRFDTGTDPLLFSADKKDAAKAEAAWKKTYQAAQEKSKKIGKFLRGAASRIPIPFQKAQGEGQKEQEENKPAQQINYPAFKASEDLANGFSDKFFSRPTWEKIEMWDNGNWYYGAVLRQVKLGHCETALELFEERAQPELSRLPDRDVAEYLHNYGVTLLCANKPEMSMEKLRSAYRINYDQSTLRMLGLAARVQEWALNVEIDQQPEVDMLMDRDGQQFPEKLQGLGEEVQSLEEKARDLGEEAQGLEEKTRNLGKEMQSSGNNTSPLEE